MITTNLERGWGRKGGREGRRARAWEVFSQERGEMGLVGLCGRVVIALFLQHDSLTTYCWADFIFFYSFIIPCFFGMHLFPVHFTFTLCSIIVFIFLFIHLHVCYFYLSSSNFYFSIFISAQLFSLHIIF